MLGLWALALLGGSYTLGPFTLVLPEGWSAEIHGTTEETSILVAAGPEGDTVTFSHAKIPGMGLLGAVLSESAFMDAQAKGEPPEGCEGSPERVEVNGHPVLIYTCEGGMVTAVCAPDMKALLTAVEKGPGGKDVLIGILEASFK